MGINMNINNINIGKHGTKILNIALVIIALIIAQKIYQAQMNVVDALKQKKEAELKKNDILTKISGLENKLNEYKNKFVKKDPSSVISSLNSIARNSGVKIVSIRPADENDYPDYSKYSFNMTVSAKDYHRIGKFISAIESSSEFYILDVAKINPFEQKEKDIKFAQKGKDAKTQDKITATITVSTISVKGG